MKEFVGKNSWWLVSVGSLMFTIIYFIRHYNYLIKEYGDIIADEEREESGIK